MKKFWTLLIGLISFQLYAQDTTFKPIIIPDIQVRDTIYLGYTLDPLDVDWVLPPKDSKLSSRDKAYLRKVYPYALRISHLVDQIEKELAELDKNRKRKKYIHVMEDMLKDQFTDDVKDLTRIQGQMLTKLVYRETNKTVFELIKGYKNGLTAGFWNMLGKFYNQDLKMKYDPEGKDYEIEKYIQYLDKVYQRDGLKEILQNEQFTPPVQDKKRKR